MLETGSMRKAHDLAHEAEAFCDSITEKGKVQLSYLYNTYGVIDMQHEDLESAKTWFQRAFHIRKEYLGECDVNTVAVKMNLVLVLLNEKRYTEARDELAPLMSQMSTMSQLPTRITSGVFDFLSIVSIQMGKFNEAWDYIQKSIDMTRDTVPHYSQGSG